MANALSISIVIPAYNRGHSIGRALRSVLDQDYPVDEILVVDDGSSDGLEKALAPFGEQIRTIRHRANMGAAEARNTGIRAATSELVAFLDSDDVWKPGKLAQQVTFMQRLSLDASCTGFETVPAGWNADPIVAWRPYPEVLRLEELVWGCYVSPGSTLIVRRDLLIRSGGYDSSFPRYEDWDLLLRLLGHTPKGIGFLDTPLATISLGSHLKLEQAHAGLERLVERHHDDLRSHDPRVARRLRSAVAFNKAYVHARFRQWPSMASELARSFFLCPVGNWPIRVILGGYVRRRLGFPP